MRNLLLSGLASSLLTLASFLPVFGGSTYPGTFVQDSQGTLYVVSGTTKYAVTPGTAPDDWLAGLTDGGALDDNFVALAPVTVSGVGAANSTDFWLDGGSYRITWTMDGHDRCSTGALSREPQEQVVAFSQTGRGTTYAYGVVPGRYYFTSVNPSDCHWTMNIQPL